MPYSPIPRLGMRLDVRMEIGLHEHTLLTNLRFWIPLLNEVYFFKKNIWATSSPAYKAPAQLKLKPI